MSVTMRARRPAFTLVELLIVVVCLATLAGVVLPYFADTSLDARVIATQNILRTTATAIDLYRIRFTRPNYPPTVMPTWFVNRKVPANPMAANGAAEGTVEVVNIANATNPANRTITSGVAPWWYNAANGIIRARVLPQDTADMTSTLYAAVNSIGQTTITAPGSTKHLMGRPPDEVGVSEPD